MINLLAPLNKIKQKTILPSDVIIIMDDTEENLFCNCLDCEEFCHQEYFVWHPKRKY
ncbi:MAG: hypothetical protein J7K26_02070 [Candidatus Aenigmarchaeota archaeon]|nr:hypothetical protein [Candidatus Aenigmarchaeota archaeon]